MADYQRVNLREDVENLSPRLGLEPEQLEARFARRELGLQTCGVSYQRLGPGFRMPFGHRHREQEEVYVLIGGSARLRVDDEIVQLRSGDAVRVAPHVMRAFEGGPEGAELLAFGVGPGDPSGGSTSGDAQMQPGWWAD